MNVWTQLLWPSDNPGTIHPAAKSCPRRSHSLATIELRAFQDTKAVGYTLTVFKGA